MSPVGQFREFQMVSSTTHYLSSDSLTENVNFVVFSIFSTSQTSLHSKYNESIVLKYTSDYSRCAAKGFLGRISWNKADAGQRYSKTLQQVILNQ